MLKRLFPIIEHLKGYSFRKFSKDARAGMNVSLLDFPQSMAYAMIAGLPIQFGVFTSALSSIVSPVFASSRFLITGPSNATAVLLMSGFLSLNLPEPERIRVLPVILIMVALFLFIGRILRIEVAIQYISRAVISGYITAAAFLICANQFKHILGIDIARSSTFLKSFSDTIVHLNQTNWMVLGFSAGVFFIYFLVNKFAKKIPGLAVTVVLSTAIYAVLSKFEFRLEALPELTSFQWPVSYPHLQWNTVNDLLGTAIAISLLCIIESTSISKTLAARSGDTVNISQQLGSLSAANLVCAFGSGMAASGSPTRSVLNYESGAKTPIASLVSGILLVVGIYILSPLLHYVPKASLASLVIIVGISLVNWDNIRVFLTSSKSDAATFLVTFIAGLLFPLNVAIYLGAGLSIALFLRKVSVPKLEEIDFNDRGELVGKTDSRRSAISIVHVEGDLFFGSTDVFLDRMRDFVQSPKLKVIILRLLNAHHIDATASLAISNLVQFARKNDRDIILSGVREDLVHCIEKSGLKTLVGDENIFEFTPENLTLSTRNALKRAQSIIGEEDTDVILMVHPDKNPLKNG